MTTGTGPSGPVLTPTPTTPAAPGTTMGMGDASGSAMRFKGRATFEGSKLTADALKNSFKNVKPENFGTTDVQLPQPDGSTRTFNVRDMHYDLGGGKMGMRLVPVRDNDPAANKQLDDLLRQEMGLSADEPIYALISYIHPEEHSGDLKQLGTEMVKTEMGTTHLGAYLGRGRTTNSPENYHSSTWSVRGYPANVQIVSLKGVPQGELNKNLVAADTVLNKGVKFPGDYKNDIYRTVDLNTTLQFYRDWIKDEPYLKNDPTWATYCAEHKTIATNIGLNVPHNLESFQEIFGAEGAGLWDQFKTKFKEANGRDFTTADETHFTPLWKMEGLTPADIRPMTKPEYDAYQAARFDGSLAAGRYSGPTPLPAGKALAWMPETTSDLVKNFMETYAPFNEVGGYASAATILGFKDVVAQRMGLTDAEYVAAAMPVINEIMAAEAMARGPADAAELPAWTQKAAAGLYVAFGGAVADLAPGGTVDAAKMGLAQAALQGVPAVAGDLAHMASLPADERNETAYNWMRGAIKDDLEQARAVRVSDPNKVEFYSPPAVTNRVVNGIVERDPNVTIRVVATAVDASEVQ